MGMTTSVAVLFARADSVYKTMPECDVYDIERDARTWPGGCPVVAHPPCRAWGQMSHMAKPRHDEKDLARFAVAMVREWGGVLEHPRNSRLWPDQGLPEPGQRDAHGGWTLGISQHWWGHRAEKLTKLYIVGVEPAEIPAVPLSLHYATHVIAQNGSPRPDLGRGRLVKGMRGWRPKVSAAEREHTPPALARWLVDLAQRCAVKAEAAV